MPLTFKGGVHPAENKTAKKTKIQSITAPALVTVPMSQHIGAHCIPLVKKGDAVEKGQLIGKPGNGLSCPVHSPVSGIVKSVENHVNPAGVKTDYIFIDNDFAERVHSSVVPFNKRITDTTAEEIIAVIENAGISGMGGASFPTHAKIKSAIGKARTLIINCAECEPYITANHRLMLEKPEVIINGMKILLKAFELKKGYLAVEDNKLDAVDSLEEAAKKSTMVEVKILRTKYPQGDERQLIYALTGKRIPTGKLPADVGCVVFNAETCAAIYNAFVYGMPLVERIVTVAGDCVEKPSNLRVPLGTPIGYILEQCGLKKQPYKLISGGPMMGTALWDMNSPVVKGTSGILAFSENMLVDYKDSCIRCGRCVEACPMQLMPTHIASFAKKGDWEMCRKYDCQSCVECGCCTFICPAAVPIVQHIRTAKFELAKLAKKL